MPWRAPSASDWCNSPITARLIEQLRQCLLERTTAMADGPAKPLPVAVNAAWQQLNELQRFALVKLSHPGHEHRNLPAALRKFGLIDSE